MGEAIERLSTEWQAGPDLDDVVIDALAGLRQAGLVERQFGDMGPATMTAKDGGLNIRLGACWWFRLTELGEAARLAQAGEGR
jgi:hypothetical protein